MIPTTGWRDMPTAPKDGTVIIVRFRHNNLRDGKVAVQAAQWFCDDQGDNWGWRAPWRTGMGAYADAWMTFEEFQAATQQQEVEFDL